MDRPLLLPAQLAHHLRSLRRLRGLSQAQLGTRLGLSQSRVARMENAPQNLSVDALMALLAALDAHLLLHVSDKKPAQRAQADAASALHVAQPNAVFVVSSQAAKKAAKRTNTQGKTSKAAQTTKPAKLTKRPVAGDW